MKKTVETVKGQAKQAQGQLAREEGRSKELTALLEKANNKACALQQELIDGNTLEHKLERQKEKVKKMSAKISSRERHLEQQHQKESELQAQVQDLAELHSRMQEGYAKLVTQNEQLQQGCAKLHEERKCVAAGIAADLFSAGQHLEAFLRTIEPELLCPITYELPGDPVLAADGWTYERAAIAKWHQENTYRSTGTTNSPMTGAPLLHEELTPNYSVKKMVALFREWQARCNDEKV